MGELRTAAIGLLFLLIGGAAGYAIGHAITRDNCNAYIAHYTAELKHRYWFVPR
ncbi:MAG TPA: hypothetical protein VKR31_10085 [Rhizomicrobium sp.]|nr:hypothetical protein [Rhizomicrobium sp.]